MQTQKNSHSTTPTLEIYFRLWIAGDRGIPGGIQVQSFFRLTQQMSVVHCLSSSLSSSSGSFSPGAGAGSPPRWIWKLFSSFLPWIILVIQAVPWFLQYMHTKNQRNFPAFPKTCKVPLQEILKPLQKHMFPQVRHSTLLIPRSHTWKFLRWSLRRCFFVFLSSSQCARQSPVQYQSGNHPASWNEPPLILHQHLKIPKLSSNCRTPNDMNSHHDQPLHHLRHKNCPVTPPETYLQHTLWHAKELRIHLHLWAHLRRSSRCLWQKLVK